MAGRASGATTVLNAARGGGGATVAGAALGSDSTDTTGGGDIATAAVGVGGVLSVGVAGAVDSRCGVVNDAAGWWSRCAAVPATMATTAATPRHTAAPALMTMTAPRGHRGATWAGPVAWGRSTGCPVVGRLGATAPGAEASVLFGTEAGTLRRGAVVIGTW